MVKARHCRLEDFPRVGFNAVILIHIAINIWGTICQALRQMQFKIRKATRIHAAAETVNGRFADIGFQRQRSNARMDCLVW